MQITNLILASLLFVDALGLPQTQLSSYRVLKNGSYQKVESSEADRLSAQVLKLFEEGRYDEALPLAKRVLEIREKQLGTDSKPVAVALCNLATIYMQQKIYDQAETAFQASLSIYAKLNDDLNAAKIADSLGLLHYQRRNFDQAEALFLRSLSLREKHWGSDHADVTQYLYGVANFYRSLGSYSKAAGTLKRIVEIKEKTGMPEQSELGEALEDYACVLREADRKTEAKKIEERVNRIFYSPTDTKDSADESSDVLNGKAISLPRPQFPKVAQAIRESASVRVRILIDESGKVLKACAVDGPGILQDASKTAALRARFTPTVKDGKPVKVIGFVTYNFRSRF